MEIDTILRTYVAYDMVLLLTNQINATRQKPEGCLLLVFFEVADFLT